MKHSSILLLVLPVVSAWQLVVSTRGANISFTGHRRRGCTYVDGDEIIGRTYSHFNFEPETVYNLNSKPEYLNCCAHLYTRRFCQQNSLAAHTCKKVVRSEIPEKYGNLYGSFEITCHDANDIVQPKWDKLMPIGPPPSPGLWFPDPPKSQLAAWASALNNPTATRPADFDDYVSSMAVDMMPQIAAVSQFAAMKVLQKISQSFNEPVITPSPTPTPLVTRKSSREDMPLTKAVAEYDTSV